MAYIYAVTQISDAVGGAIISDYKKGDSLKVLQQKYQAQSSVISKYLKAHNVKLRKRGYIVHNGRNVHISQVGKALPVKKAATAPSKPASNGNGHSHVVTIPSGLPRDALIELVAPLYANGISFKFNA